MTAVSDSSVAECAMKLHGMALSLHECAMKLVVMAHSLLECVKEVDRDSTLIAWVCTIVEAFQS